MIDPPEIAVNITTADSEEFRSFHGDIAQAANYVGRNHRPPKSLPTTNFRPVSPATVTKACRGPFRGSKTGVGLQERTAEHMMGRG